MSELPQIPITIRSLEGEGVNTDSKSEIEIRELTVRSLEKQFISFLKEHKGDKAALNECQTALQGLIQKVEELRQTLEHEPVLAVHETAGGKQVATAQKEGAIPSPESEKVVPYDVETSVKASLEETIRDVFERKGVYSNFVWLSNKFSNMFTKINNPMIYKALDWINEDHFHTAKDKQEIMEFVYKSTIDENRKAVWERITKLGDWLKQASTALKELEDKNCSEPLMETVRRFREDWEGFKMILRERLGVIVREDGERIAYEISENDVKESRRMREREKAAEELPKLSPQMQAKPERAPSTPTPAVEVKPEETAELKEYKKDCIAMVTKLYQELSKIEPTPEFKNEYALAIKDIGERKDKIEKEEFHNRADYEGELISTASYLFKILVFKIRSMDRDKRVSRQEPDESFKSFRDSVSKSWDEFKFQLQDKSYLICIDRDGVSYNLESHIAFNSSEEAQKLNLGHRRVIVFGVGWQRPYNAPKELNDIPHAVTLASVTLVSPEEYEQMSGRPDPWSIRTGA